MWDCLQCDDGKFITICAKIEKTRGGSITSVVFTLNAAIVVFSRSLATALQGDNVWISPRFEAAAADQCTNVTS